MGVLLFVLTWIVIGIIISATALGLLGVPVRAKKWSWDTDQSLNDTFICGMVFGSILWPLTLAVAVAFFPARALYQRSFRANEN